MPKFTDGARYLFERSKTDSRLAALLLDLDRQRFDHGLSRGILKSIVDLAWHRSVNEFSDGDAWQVAAELTGDHNHLAADIGTLKKQLERSQRALLLLLELSDKNDYAAYRSAVRELAAYGIHHAPSQTVCGHRGCSMRPGHSPAPHDR